MTLTPEQRQALEWMTESLTLRPLDRQAIAAVLADLDSCEETLAGALVEIDRLHAAHVAALADLDAATVEVERLRAALPPAWDAPPSNRPAETPEEAAAAEAELWAAALELGEGLGQC